MTVEPLWLVAVASFAALLTAWLLTPVVKVFIDSQSLWVRSHAHLYLAALAGVGAAALADNAFELLAFTGAAVGCALLIVIDLAVHRLPDLLVAGTGLVLLVSLAGTAAVDDAWNAFGRSILASVILLCAYFVLALITPTGLGLGDVKFAAVIGLLLGWFGWTEVAIGTLLGFTLNGTIALVMIISRRGNHDSEVPFGPSMVLGAALALAISL